MPNKSRTLLILIATLFLALFFLPQFVSLYVDWLWFKDVGFEKIFTTKINAQAIDRLGRPAGRFSYYLHKPLVFHECHKGQVCCNCFIQPGNSHSLIS